MVVWQNPVISIYHSPYVTQNILPTRATRAARPTTRAPAVLIITKIQLAGMSSLAWFDPSAGIGAALHLKALFVQMRMVMMVILWVELMIVIQSIESILLILLIQWCFTLSATKCDLFIWGAFFGLSFLWLCDYYFMFRPNIIDPIFKAETVPN